MPEASGSDVLTELLRATVDEIDLGVIVAGPDGQLLYVNESAARLHGLRQLGVEPDAYAEAYQILTADGDPFPSRELPLSRAVLDGATVEEAQWRIRRPDGTEVLAVGSARPILGADGHRSGAVLTVRQDYSPLVIDADRKDRDLLARRLRAAFEQSPVSTVVYDAGGRPVAVNPAFEKLWGASIANVPDGYTVLSDPQLEAAGVMPTIRRAFAGEEVNLPPLKYEMGSYAGRGKALWTRAHLYPVRDASGAIEQVVLTHEDVTARRALDLALSRALAQTQQLQMLTAALSEATTSGDVGSAVVEHARPVLGAAAIIIASLTHNGTMLELLNVAKLADGIIEPWRAFPVTAPVPLAEAVCEAQPIFLESPEQWLARYPHMAGDLESTGHRATIVLPLIVDGRTVGVIGAAFNQPQGFDEETRALALTVAHQCAQALDRSRLLESERAARLEAESANRAKSDFLAIMSHELRTPLNAIGGYSELLEMGVHGPLTEDQLRDIGRIQASQRHLLGLINEVLNYAKLESGSVTYDITRIPMQTALATAQMLVTPQARAKGLALSISACADGAAALADAEKLQQILVNLLSNAVKFTDRGHIVMTCDIEGDRVLVAVTDTGIGISREQLGRIFEPFVQVRANFTRTAEGTGLGLAISRDLARAMNGDLLVRSQPGQGSTFTLVLPGVPSSGVPS